MSTRATWLQTPLNDTASLERLTAERLKSRFHSGSINLEEYNSVTEMKRTLFSGALKLGPQELENLRKLCQLWDIDIRPVEVTSHRKFIGPFIVLGKKIIYPILRVLLKDLLRQQREFNATSLSMIAYLIKDKNAQ